MNGNMNELHLFSGAGGGILAGQLLGHRCVCAVEWEPYAQAVLVARQNDGTFPPFPIWDDVQTFRGEPWRGIVDVVCGGFPCQDISAAGKGAGIDGERSGMWGHMARIIGEVRPRFVLVENSPILTSRGLGRVLGDLAALGFDARWDVLGASDVGAPHKRERIWIFAVAHTELRRVQIRRGAGNPGADIDRPRGICGHERQSGQQQAPAGVANADSLRQPQSQGCECDQRGRPCNCGAAAHLPDSDSDSDSVQRLEPEPQPGGHRRPAGLHDRARSFPAWPDDPANAPESGVDRVVNGMAHRSNRLKAIGNGQVPLCAATAWRLLSNF